MNVSATTEVLQNSAYRMNSVTSASDATTDIPVVAFVNSTSSVLRNETMSFIMTTSPSPLTASTEYLTHSVNGPTGMTTYFSPCASYPNDMNCTTALPRNDSKDLHFTALIGAAAGFSIVVIILAGVLLYHRRYRRQQNTRQPNQSKRTLTMETGDLDTNGTPGLGQLNPTNDSSRSDENSLELEDDIRSITIDPAAGPPISIDSQGCRLEIQDEAYECNDPHALEVIEPESSEASHDEERNNNRVSYVDVIVTHDQDKTSEIGNAEDSICTDDTHEEINHIEPIVNHTENSVEDQAKPNEADPSLGAGRSKSVELQPNTHPQYVQNRDSRPLSMTGSTIHKQGNFLKISATSIRDSGYNSLPSLHSKESELPDIPLSDRKQSSVDGSVPESDENTVENLRRQFKEKAQEDSSETWGTPTFAIKRIGANGDTLTLPDGTATLKVPEGALKAAKDIHIYRKPFQTSTGIPVIDCGPDGISFDKPVTLIVECDHLTLDPKKLAVFAKNDGEDAWADLSDRDGSKCEYDKERGEITFTLTHFTKITAAENSADISDDDNTSLNDLNAPGANASPPPEGATCQTPQGPSISETNVEKEIPYHVKIFVNCNGKGGEFRIHLIREDDRVKWKDIRQRYTAFGWKMPCPDVDTVIINTSHGHVQIKCNGETKGIILDNLLKCPQYVGFGAKPGNEQIDLLIRQEDSGVEHLLKTLFPLLIYTGEDKRNARKELSEQYFVKEEDAMRDDSLYSRTLCLVRQPQNKDAPSLCLPQKVSDVNFKASTRQELTIVEAEEDHAAKRDPIQHDDRTSHKDNESPEDVHANDHASNYSSEFDSNPNTLLRKKTLKQYPHDSSNSLNDSHKTDQVVGENIFVGFVGEETVNYSIKTEPGSHSEEKITEPKGTDSGYISGPKPLVGFDFQINDRGNFLGTNKF